MQAGQTRILIGLVAVIAIAVVIILVMQLRAATALPASAQTATVRSVFQTIDAGLNK